MKKIETDIIIIAAGAAGLSAAVAAVQKGASVIVFEKNAITGGTANKGMGPLGIESRHTRARLLQPTKDEAFKVFMDYTHWRVDAKLVRAFLNKAVDPQIIKDILTVASRAPEREYEGAAGRTVHVLLQLAEWNALAVER